MPKGNNRVTKDQHYQALLAIQHDQGTLEKLILENRAENERQFGELKEAQRGFEDLARTLGQLYGDQHGMLEAQAGRIDGLQASDRRWGVLGPLAGLISGVVSGIVSGRPGG